MAVEKSQQGVNQPSGSAYEPSRSQSGKARKVRVSTDHLSEDAKYALRTVLNARAACAMLGNKIKRGLVVNDEVLELCGQFAASANRK